MVWNLLTCHNWSITEIYGIRNNFSNCHYQRTYSSYPGYFFIPFHNFQHCYMGWECVPWNLQLYVNTCISEQFWVPVTSPLKGWLLDRVEASFRKWRSLPPEESSSASSEMRTPALGSSWAASARWTRTGSPTSWSSTRVSFLVSSIPRWGQSYEQL